MSLRVKAFLIHLLVSAVIAALVVLVVFTYWYPAPLDKALNVTEIFLLLLIVDVTLGPLLTLLVFKVGKKTLVFDLSVIALLQLAALCYGLWTVAAGRPAWIVFNVDRFDLVQVVAIDPRNVNQAKAEYRQPSLLGPRWVAAKRPEDKVQRQEIMFEAILLGSDIANRPNLYVPLADMAADIAGRAQPLAELNNFNNPDDVNKVLAAWPSATKWLPLIARIKPMVVLLSGNGSDVVAIVDLRPL